MYQETMISTNNPPSVTCNSFIPSCIPVHLYISTSNKWIFLRFPNKNKPSHNATATCASLVLHSHTHTLTYPNHKGDITNGTERRTVPIDCLTSSPDNRLACWMIACFAAYWPIRQRVVLRLIDRFVNFWVKFFKNPTIAFSSKFTERCWSGFTTAHCDEYECLWYRAYHDNDVPIVFNFFTS